MSPKRRANLKNRKNISAIQKFWQNMKKKMKPVSPETFKSGVFLQNINYEQHKNKVKVSVFKENL